MRRLFPYFTRPQILSRALQYHYGARLHTSSAFRANTGVDSSSEASIYGHLETFPPIKGARLVDPLNALVKSFGKEDAKREFCWMQAYIHDRNMSEDQLIDMVQQRSSGVPLQHLLGTAFFGNVEFLVDKDVFIPRDDTAHQLTYLQWRLHRFLAQEADHIGAVSRPLHILDVCTGSGCIALTIAAQLGSYRRCDVYVNAIDISDKALQLAEKNRWRCLNLLDPKSGRNTSLERVKFTKGDVLRPESFEWPAKCDILLSNPPYICPDEWSKLSSSVRDHEPKDALVPSLCPDALGMDPRRVHPADVFYNILFSQADRLATKLIWFEIGDVAQAKRVVNMAKQRNWPFIESWGDNVRVSADGEDLADVRTLHNDVIVRGTGSPRSVVCARGEAVHWIESTSSPARTGSRHLGG